MKFLVLYPDLDPEPGLQELLKSFGETVVVSGEDEAEKIAEKIGPADYDGIFLSLDKNDGGFVSSFMKSLPRNVSENIGKSGPRIFLVSGRKDLIAVLKFFRRDGITALSTPVEKYHLSQYFDRETIH